MITSDNRSKCTTRLMFHKLMEYHDIRHGILVINCVDVHLSRSIWKTLNEKCKFLTIVIMYYLLIAFLSNRYTPIYCLAFAKLELVYGLCSVVFSSTLYLGSMRWQLYGIYLCVMYFCVELPLYCISITLTSKSMKSGEA